MSFTDVHEIDQDEVTYNLHLANLMFEREGQRIRVQAGGESFIGTIYEVNYLDEVVVMKSGTDNPLTITLDLGAVEGVLIFDRPYEERAQEQV